MIRKPGQNFSLSKKDIFLKQKCIKEDWNNADSVFILISSFIIEFWTFFQSSFFIFSRKWNEFTILKPMQYVTFNRNNNFYNNNFYKLFFILSCIVIFLLPHKALRHDSIIIGAIYRILNIILNLVYSSFFSFLCL